MTKLSKQRWDEYFGFYELKFLVNIQSQYWSEVNQEHPRREKMKQVPRRNWYPLNFASEVQIHHGNEQHAGKIPGPVQMRKVYEVTRSYKPNDKYAESQMQKIKSKKNVVLLTPNARINQHQSHQIPNKL